MTELEVSQREFDELFAAPTDLVIKQIDALLRKHFRKYYNSLRPGLKPQQIASFEARLGVTFPEDYKSLLRWKNGSRETNAPYWGGQFCGCEEAIENSTMLMEITRDSRFGFKPRPDFDDINSWWNPGWVPLISEYMSSDMLCLDTVGSFTGKPGQIIYFIHDAYYRPVKHESINRWLLTTHAVLFSMKDDPKRGPMKELDFDRIMDETERKETIEEIANPGYPIKIGGY